MRKIKEVLKKISTNEVDNNLESENIEALKITMAVVGGGGIGSSASVIRFIQDYFFDEYDPTIEDFYTKIITIDNKKILP